MYFVPTCVLEASAGAQPPQQQVQEVAPSEHLAMPPAGQEQPKPEDEQHLRLPQQQVGAD